MKTIVGLMLLGFGGTAFAQDEPAPVEAKAQTLTYTLDPAASFLGVLIKYDRNAVIAGHDHMIVAKTFTGKVTWNQDDASVCDVQIQFPVSALEVDPGDSRAKHGLEGQTSDGDKSSIADNLRGKHQLNSSLFANVEFKSASCTKNGTKFDVTGPLTMHGVGHDVKATMVIAVEDGALKASGKFTGTHADWGMDPFSALFGALKNETNLAFSVDVTGRP